MQGSRNGSRICVRAREIALWVVLRNDAAPGRLKQLTDTSVRMRVSFFITKVIERSGYVMRALAIGWGAPYQLVSHSISMSVTEPLRGCAPITIEFFARPERGSEDVGAREGA
jgi:hypothetical protein